ncbi:MAG: ATP synthase F0 subunit C [Oscillospiraceae bacterium]|jgi:F-type H+-transporting ATPase subunit c|nr:ATP synthase F0 subunit C [Oscillospiraceae bacterium]
MELLYTIGAGLAILGAGGAGIGMGIATGRASEAVGRQPEASGKINALFLMGCALAESTAIYGLLVALIILFVSPNA